MISPSNDRVRTQIEPEPPQRTGRYRTALAERTMADNRRNGALGLVLGGIFAIAAAVFILSGGVGVKEVNSDADLPPIASGTK
jgi:hypothetical protein